MSAGNGSASRFDRVRDVPLYDQVPFGSLPWGQEIPYPLGDVPATSYDPLPPPPLPENPPVGPDFYPSDGEDQVDDAIDIKPIRRFIPDSVKNFFRGSSNSGSKKWPFSPPSDNVNTTTQGVPCSPPPSPTAPSSYLDPYGGSGGSYASRKEQAMLLGEPLESVSGRSLQTAMTYSEKVEDYNQRYAYMKSWAGLLRILGCMELLLGAAVFACVCAYVHKDNEWFNMFGYTMHQMYGGGYGGSSMGGMYGGGGISYTGPLTPFVIVVAGLAWIVTIILVVLGMTMYYRTILLDANWWPITEGVINLALAILYMTAAIVYVRDTVRGGLCYYPHFNAGPNAGFCRTEAGQTAAIIFLFFNMLLYLVGAGVCVKLWRHEAARMRRERLCQDTKAAVPLTMIDLGSSVSAPVYKGPLMASPETIDGTAPSVIMEPEILRGHIPSGHIPKPVIIADYVAKYPTIRTDEERERYKAVFNDQYAEYKELHAEVQVLTQKFEEMDNLMRNLQQQPTSHMEQERIHSIVQEYNRKKADPTFLEKRDRCEYLKNKLAHIKQKIQEYDKVMDWNDGYS
ncbi:MARVEL domain-containing protein 2 [Triplophysa tibetana]|uniref:MARVEL domain-containing protein 2 n=1 Tax=Triplophysa tibetana TaxID=1572043 RepID=A0A5A9P8H8_9TELE|nr:MARVEL domain-containing protein 2 [Triplophysa tibetana]